MTPKVSLIIPVYNAASYIEACIASLMVQTIDEIEVVFVDDHGTDNSIQIAQTYINTHPCSKHFRFLSTPHNMGPGPARNVGIEASRGEYISFIDSDDGVTPDFCENLYAAASAHDADLVYCQAQLVTPHGEKVMSNPVIENGEFSEEKRRYFLSHYTTLFVSFLYRRSLLTDYEIRFPATRSSEDSYFLTSSLLATKRIACVDKPMYRYLIHEESLSESCNPKRYLDKVESFDLLMQFARKKELYEPNREELDYIYLKKGYLLGLLTYIYNEEHPQRIVVHNMHNHMLNYVPHYRGNRYYRADLKLRLLHVLIRQCTRISFKVLPYYIRKTGMKL